VTYASEYIALSFTGKIASCMQHIFSPASSKKAYQRNIDAE